MPRMIASYSAVAPHGARRSTERMRSAGSVAFRVSVNTVSLKPSSVTWLAAGTAPRKFFTARFSRGITGVMLPLMSTATMSSSGTSSEAKYPSVCGLPSSNT